ncbi:DUF3231 family protein [Ectobacillus funiculus]|uniref:DUF3231 family protein n=1 Tax=Ectobacillus funiculus TaxID=137993 RepID=A0ABV5WG32_9BACI
METIKPIEISLDTSNPKEKLTSAEMGKLWATYMGNSMSKCILSYYLQHVEDNDIKKLLENASQLSLEMLKTIEEIFTKENFPIPQGFTEKDVNLGAPRLFEDQFYVHYLKYVAKAGMSIYNVAIPLVYRKDIREFYVYCMNSTMALMEQIKDILMNKGFIMKPPVIPVPDKVEFVHQDFLNGFFGHVRPLHALEIAHFYDNIENNLASKALIMGFAQVTRNEKVRELFERGRELVTTNTEHYMQKLHDENLPSPSFRDDLVTTSTFAPFSDKLMLFHKMDMFAMKLRSFGNSVAVNGRHDIASLYSNVLMKNSAFVQEVIKIMIENGWLEQPPKAVDRENLASG